jgi:D-arabinose 1-dehydrogenase-like Zn-dependent alcohol dehydrogenase
MRAAVLEQFNEPLVVRELPDPIPGPGQAVVRTRAAGVCRTDLKIIEGGIPTIRLPLVLGHELAGEVAAPGDGGPPEGSPVIVGLDFNCGACEYCRRGQLDYCARLQRLGLEQNGALAEYVLVPTANLIEVPAAISFSDAATIPDAIGSPYHAVMKRAGVTAGQTVAVYGLGGLGLVAIQVAALAGARVIAIARTDERRRLAEDLGAAWSIDPNDGEVSQQIRELTNGLGVHAFIDIVGIEGSVEQGVLSCRKGGSVVVLGYVVPQLVVGMMRLVYDEVSIMGSRGSTRADLMEAIDLVGRGLIRPVIGAEMDLDAINAGLDQLRDGSVIGRSVILFP